MSIRSNRKPPPTASSTARYLICYQGISGSESRRWHRFLRHCGTRVIPGLYEVEYMTPRLSRQLYQEALEATGEGGMIRIYPVCRGCERRGWSVGKGTERSTLNSVDYFII